MSKRRPANIAASVRRRLLDLSRSTGEPFDIVLTRYALERFLHRLGASQYADRFVLKGAMLLAAWGGVSHRSTRDLDLLGYGDLSVGQLTILFREICRMEVEPDGLVFDTNDIRVEDIREHQEYTGRRVRFIARLAKAQITMQVDIGIGDTVVPETKEMEYPTLLEFPAPRIRAYPPESVVSEKLQAMVALGMQNSRMKDFYDIWVISRQSAFDGGTLVEAIKATFKRRVTDIPPETPTALTNDFATDPGKTTLWKAFLGRTGLGAIDASLPQIIADVRIFAVPPLAAASRNMPFDRQWTAGGPWS